MVLHHLLWLIYQKNFEIETAKMFEPTYISFQDQTVKLLNYYHIKDKILPDASVNLPTSRYVVAIRIGIFHNKQRQQGEGIGGYKQTYQH